MMAAAIYPGTFDPFTHGHLDIVERACRAFGSLVVAVSQNPSKSPLFPLEERIAMVKESTADIEGVSVESFDGLLVAHARRTGARVLVKGVRAPSDVEYETQMAQMNAALADVETVFLVATPTHGFISSSLVREVARLGGDITAFVPPTVARRLKERFPSG